MKTGTSKETTSKKIIFHFGLVFALAACASEGVDRADVNTPINISYAVVLAEEAVTIKSDVGKSAASGGVLGLVLGAVIGGDVAGAAVGAASGAAVSAATTKIQEGSSEAVSYTLQRADRSVFKVVVPLDGLDPGECVAVESGRTTTLRRVEKNLCPQLLDSATEQGEAGESSAATDCQVARQQLLNAVSDSEITAAAKKIKVLCEPSS